MKTGSIGYLCKEGVKNIWINRLMSIASVGILTACLLILGFAVLITASLTSMMKYVESQVEIIVYIKDDAKKSDIDEAYLMLNDISGVTQVEYITKDQAFEEFKGTLEDEWVLDKIKDTHPIPASFKITVEDYAEISQLEQAIINLDIQENYRVPTDFAETIVKIRGAVNSFGLIAIIALVFISVIVISNTIRASVFARRTEIGIMKQVGATDNFIRIPFIIEGAAIGLIAAAFAYILILFTYPQLSNVLGVNNTLGDSLFFEGLINTIIPLEDKKGELILYFTSGGLITGIIASVLSLRNYLKV